MKKLLLLSVSTGAGHIRAAEAIKKTAAAIMPEVETLHLDMMDHVSRTMRSVVVDSYEIMARKLPEIWGFFYDRTNNTKHANQMRKLTNIFHRFNCKKLYTAIREFEPDHILCTNFLPAGVLRYTGQDYGISAPLSVLITDYDTHAFWLVPNLKNYFVATEKMRWKMLNDGFPNEHITVSGIPVEPSFLKDKDTSELKKRYEIPDKKVVLILSGGFGMMKSDVIVETLFQSKEPLHIIAVAGKNIKLLAKLQKLVPPPHISVEVTGWTDKMDEYMRIADIVVTKPGGLTTTECLALKKPIIAIEPIPGQEECNIEYILREQVGVVAPTKMDLLYYVAQTPSDLAPGYSKIISDNQKNSAKTILQTISQN